MREFAYGLIEKGTQHHQNHEDKRRCRILNGLTLISISLLIPLAIIINLIENRYDIVLIGFTTLIIYSIGLYANWIGQLLTSSILVFIISIGLIMVVIYLSEVQTSAVFALINIAIGSLYVFESKKLKYTFMVLCLALFFALNYYQLTSLPFDLSEYAPIIPLLILFYFGITFSESEIQRHRKKIENQNEQLTKKNITIKRQATELNDAEKAKHEKELELKQKDLEMVLASSSARDQLAHNIRKRLKTVMVSENIKSELSILINELNLQKDLINKQGLISENMGVVNVEFYDRLNKKNPDLTKLEREFCAYLKLNLSNKEIAAIKNCTVNTVNVGKTRLRKKLGFDTNKQLAQYLRDF